MPQQRKVRRLGDIRMKYQELDEKTKPGTSVPSTKIILIYTLLVGFTYLYLILFLKIPQYSVNKASYLYPQNAALVSNKYWIRYGYGIYSV